MSGGGGDQEVRQTSEPFPQQLPYVNNVFSLADARRRSLTPGSQPGPFDAQNAGPPGNGLQVSNRGTFYYRDQQGRAIPTTGPNAGFYNNVIPGRPQSGAGAYLWDGGQYTGGVQPGGQQGGNVPTPYTGQPQYLGSGAGGVQQGGQVGAPGPSFNQRAAEFGLPTFQFYPGQTVAGQSGDTLAAQALARGAAGNVAYNNERGSAALNRLLGGPNVNNDPTLEAFAQASTRPLYSARDQALSDNDDRAIAQGAFGGSRQALARGSIDADFQQNLGDTRAKIFNNAYNQQFAGQQNALGQLGAVNQQQTQPAQIFSQVGQQNEEFQQQLINANRERFDFEQSAPDLALNQYANLINQFSGPTAATQRVDSSGNPIGSFAGGALTGIAARSLFNSSKS